MDTNLGTWVENNNEFEHLNRRRAFHIGKRSRLSAGVLLKTSLPVFLVLIRKRPIPW